MNNAYKLLSILAGLSAFTLTASEVVVTTDAIAEATQTVLEVLAEGKIDLVEAAQAVAEAVSPAADTVAAAVAESVDTVTEVAAVVTTQAVAQVEAVAPTVQALSAQWKQAISGMYTNSVQQLTAFNEAHPTVVKAAALTAAVLAVSGVSYAVYKKYYAAKTQGKCAKGVKLCASEGTLA